MDIKDLKKAGVSDAKDIDIKEVDIKQKGKETKIEEIRIKREKDKERKSPGKIKKIWKKFWFLLWKDNSLKGWIFSVLFLFIFIKLMILFDAAFGI